MATVEKKLTFSCVLGAQLCYCYFLHALLVGNNEMEPVVQFNKIYIYWRILSDQLVILISSRGRTTRFQIKCIARPGSTIYYYLHRYSISILVELDISTAYPHGFHLDTGLHLIFVFRNAEITFLGHALVKTFL